MPLIKGKSQKAFVHNLKTEMEHGHPQKQSLAIAYAMKRKAQHKAKGGRVYKDYEHNDAPTGPTGYRNRNKSSDLSGGQRRGPSGYPKYQEQAQYEKGIHTPVSGVTGFPGGKGESEAGNMAKQTWGGKPHRELVEHGKELHKKKLEEIKSFPKPKLKGLWSGGYAEGEDVKPEPQSQPPLVDPDKAKAFMASFKGQKKAHGGFIAEEEASGYHAMPEEHEMYNAPAMHEDEKDLNQHGDDEGPMPAIHHDEDDLVARIMHMPSKDFSHEARLSMGGRVANADHGMNDEDLAGFSPNEFDDLVLRDDLESTYGEDDNSGDALSDAQEDHDRQDIVARIMASQRKKSKMPPGYPGR